MKERLMNAWRILVAMGMVGIIVLAAIFAYMFYEHKIRDARQNRVWTMDSEYSDKYVVEKGYKYTRFKDIKSGKYLTPKMDFLYDNNLKDSITVFRVDRKRGFVNINSGQVVIPAQYDKAWIFSEELGAVVIDGKVGFVNIKGETVIPFQYQYLRDTKNEVDFLFKSGYCTVIGDNGKHGLIDKQGKWAIEPQYDYINNPARDGLRIVTKGDKYGIMDSTFQILLPIEYDFLKYSEDGIVLTREYKKWLVAFDCKTVLKPFVFDGATRLTYSTDKQNDEGEFISAHCDVYYYYVNGRYGLINLAGRPITPPLYSGITAISKDMFRCGIDSNGHEVLVNAKGEEIK